jgi:hypothetical protein
MSEIDSSFHKLLQKDKAASSIFHDASMNSTFDNKFHLSQKIDDFRVPDQTTSSALSQTMRHYSSFGNLDSVISSELIKHPTRKRDYTINYNKSADYNFKKELNKTKIQHLLNPKDSYQNKWNHMVDARNQTRSFEKFKKEQNFVKKILNDTISLNRR